MSNKVDQKSGKHYLEGMTVDSLTSPDDVICMNCQKKSKVIWVHGHGQCSNCGVNILPCCNGEVCQKLSK